MKSEKKGGKGRKAQRQQHSLQQLSFPFLGRSEEAKEEEVSIDGGERRERGGDSSLLYSAGCWLRSCASSLGPTAGGDGFGPEVGRGEGGWRRGTNPPLFKVSLGW